MVKICVAKMIMRKKNNTFSDVFFFLAKVKKLKFQK